MWPYNIWPIFETMRERRVRDDILCRFCTSIFVAERSKACVERFVESPYLEYVKLEWDAPHQILERDEGLC